MHRLDAGHFAVEDHVDYIAHHIRKFYAEKVVGAARRSAAALTVSA